jgi:hypothetical protein
LKGWKFKAISLRMLPWISTSQTSCESLQILHELRCLIDFQTSDAECLIEVVESDQRDVH